MKPAPDVGSKERASAQKKSPLPGYTVTKLANTLGANANPALHDLWHAQAPERPCDSRWVAFQNEALLTGRALFEKVINESDSKVTKDATVLARYVLALLLRRADQAPLRSPSAPTIKDTTLTFWAPSCIAKGPIQRITFDRTTLKWNITDAKEIDLEASQKRDLLGWARQEIESKTFARQMAATKRLKGCPVPGANKLLRDVALSKTFETVRARAITTLATCSRTGVLPFLRAAAKDKDLPAFARQRAIDALVRLSDRKARPLLRRIAGEDGPLSVRHAARRGLARIK